MAGEEELLGIKHPSTRTSVGNVAILLQDQGKLSEAELLCRRALADEEKLLGPKHPNTLISVVNLA